MTAHCVGDVMTRGSINVHADSPLTAAARLMDTYRISGMPVVDRDGQVVGVISQTDLLRARVVDHLWKGLPGLAVRHVMTAPAVTASESMMLDEAASLMEERQIHRLVVVAQDGRTPVGVLSVSELVHEMLRR